MNVKLVCLAAVAGLMSSAVQAQDVPRRVSSEELARMFETPAGPLALGSGGQQMLVVRRLKSGEAEVHEAMSDLFIVRAGRATVLVGGKAEGQRQTGPGEWRGGTISGAQSHEVGPGDLLWIPAGVPHQVTLPGGSGDFSYLVVKIAKPK